MSERTEELVRELVSGLRPVRRLPQLGRVAAGVMSLAFGLALARLAYASLTGVAWLKPDFGSVDAQTIAVHALLAASALAFALGALVPGRERLSRSAALVLVLVFLGLVWIAGERLAAWSGFAALASGWVGATVECSLSAIVPAILPALLLARFAARAATHGASVAVLVGAAASIAPLTLPGILGCGYPDELHQLIGHALAPVLGALLLSVLVLPVYFSTRPRTER